MLQAPRTADEPRPLNPTRGRLLTRLSLSHVLPVLLVTAALAVLLAATVKVTAVLSALNDTELVALRHEGRLHRAMWDIDVALRHAHDACAEGAEPPGARLRLGPLVEVLRQAVASAPPDAAMRPMAEDYLALAGDVDASVVCDRLLGREADMRREQLDENLTNLWVTRLHELHDAVTRREEEARQIGTAATWVGLALALVSLLLALLVARQMARSVSLPLVSLVEAARRVGTGDFATPVAVDGPLEVQVLADELERMRQRLAQLDSLKQGFLASVSHELRTPLSKIREALALLSDGVVGPLEARQSRVVEIARVACEREIRMVSTLLDLSRLRSGSPLRPRAGSSIDAIIDGAVADESQEAELRGVEIEVVRRGEAPHLQLDPVLLERAVANLVRNAVSVSQRGQRVLVARTVELAEDGRGEARIVVTIRDEGPGVPAAIREIVFDAFVTHAVPQSGRVLGVGLGLALAREIARAHGGDLTLDDGASAGATFRLWLPAQRRSEGPAA
ncbi:sensor histidine kinase [Nannocystis pusilla]|uniref:histidine kinase n=1 Tax=Nannocystis pusilla TaxID=889268 RepID=A0ABS7TKR7_9BACT|nr:HAMP domain-containing sensor histidine kinase [Nannocystis pusilla]MBZ5708822.1 HAMP domain-containing histidine kinase [Nannocystis pusilla]